jgi:hypothetical protein
MPSHHADNEVECSSRVAARQKNGEPREDGDENRSKKQESQHNEVRDRKQPLDKWKPPIELSGNIRIVDVEVEVLLVICGRVFVT